MSQDTFTCVIEIPRGSRNKYEWDAELGGMRLDRYVAAPVAYPTDYGYFVDTLAVDGDPLDALVCVSEPTFPGCFVVVKVVGLFRMEDEKGPDDHVVCVPVTDPGWNGIDDVEELPKQLRAEIGHFFSVYKDLDPDRHSTVHGWGGPADGLATIAEAQRRFRDS